MSSRNARGSSGPVSPPLCVCEVVGDALRRAQMWMTRKPLSKPSPRPSSTPSQVRSTSRHPSMMGTMRPVKNVYRSRRSPVSGWTGVSEKYKYEFVVVDNTNYTRYSR